MQPTQQTDWHIKEQLQEGTFWGKGTFNIVIPLRAKESYGGKKKFSAPFQIKIGMVMLILNVASRLEQSEFPATLLSWALPVLQSPAVSAYRDGWHQPAAEPPGPAYSHHRF